MDDVLKPGRYVGPPPSDRHRRPFALTGAINAGTLHVVGVKTGTGIVTVGTATATAAAGVLSGTGSVAGPVTVKATGVIAPGASAGTLTLPNGVTFESGGTYLWDLAQNTVAGPGTNWDVLDIGVATATIQSGVRFVPNFIGTATVPDSLASGRRSLMFGRNACDGR